MTGALLCLRINSWSSVDMQSGGGGAQLIPGDLPRTIQQLDDVIYYLYSTKKLGSNNSSGQLNSKPENMIPEGGQSMTLQSKGLQSIYTSGNYYDCLIHAFLGDTCASYRRLTNSQKNVAANVFRRRIFPKYPEFQSMNSLSQQMVISNITTKEGRKIGLGSSVAKKLGEIFSLNIVVLTRDDIEERAELMNHYGFGLQAFLNTLQLNSANNFIFIYNPGDFHFRSVRRVSDNTYVFPYAEGRAILDSYFPSSRNFLEQQVPLSQTQLATLNAAGVDFDFLKSIHNSQALSNQNVFQLAGVPYTQGGKRKNRKTRRSKNRMNRKTNRRRR